MNAEMHMAPFPAASFLMISGPISGRALICAIFFSLFICPGLSGSLSAPSGRAGVFTFLYPCPEDILRAFSPFFAIFSSLLACP